MGSSWCRSRRGGGRFGFLSFVVAFSFPSPFSCCFLVVIVSMWSLLSRRFYRRFSLRSCLIVTVAFIYFTIRLWHSRRSLVASTESCRHLIKADIRTMNWDDWAWDLGGWLLVVPQPVVKDGDVLALEVEVLCFRPLHRRDVVSLGDAEQWFLLVLETQQALWSSDIATTRVYRGPDVAAPRVRAWYHCALRSWCRANHT